MPARLAPPRATLVVTACLALVFVAEVAVGRAELSGLLGPSVRVLNALGGIVSALVLERHEWWRLVAGPLMHGDLLHLVLNGVVLVFAGAMVEARIGPARWLLLYGVGATAGAVTSSFVNGAGVVSIGASGAVMALLAAMGVLAFTVDDRQARTAMLVNSLRFLVPSLLPIAERGQLTDIAAHAGGAVGGAVVGLLFLVERGRLDGVMRAGALAMLGFTLAGVAFTVREAPGQLVMVGAWPYERHSAAIERACSLGSRVSCITLGTALDQRDPDRAVSVLEPFCGEPGDARACFALGLAQTLREPPRLVESGVAYERACVGGEPAACFNRALQLEGQPAATARIIELLERACSGLGHAATPETVETKACVELAMHLQESDPPRAWSLVERACVSENDGAGCALAATWLWKGVGVAVDQSRARSLAEKACRLKSPSGCNAAGVLWGHGVGGPMDLVKAVGFYEQACAAHDAQSCTNLAIALKDGNGVEVDLPRARMLLLQSCRAGLSMACDGIAELTDEADHASLAEVFEVACAARAAAACRWLGSFAERGVHHAVDRADASAHYREACELGDADGCAWAADLLGPAQVDEAKSLRARACAQGLEAACVAR